MFPKYVWELSSRLFLGAGGTIWGNVCPLQFRDNRLSIAKFNLPSPIQNRTAPVSKSPISDRVGSKIVVQIPIPRVATDPSNQRRVGTGLVPALCPPISGG